ncbi:unnamed protein product [Vicia faba]|uniref:Uncharacterized protein n=1 Tax=Vicia faba TaxID=3906 RepID=A0AAV1A0T3_VICFA|nr:unnamed protein product [Vicia faba]
MSSSRISLYLRLVRDIAIIKELWPCPSFDSVFGPIFVNLYSDFSKPKWTQGACQGVADDDEDVLQRSKRGRGRVLVFCDFSELLKNGEDEVEKVERI